MDNLNLSVIFITKNEEFHIGNAIDNVKDIAEEIFVVDSGSTDRTVEIAKAKGAQVLFHPFEGFGAQWNWALDNCPVKSAWTMKMDPDERLTDELKREVMKRIETQDSSIGGYSFERVLWFMGKRLPHVRNTITRVWHTGKCHFTAVTVNEHPDVDGRVVKLHGKMEHFDSKDLHQWIEKQNRYSTLEAKRMFEGGDLAASPRLFGSSLERRMWLKQNFFKLPGRYFILFVYYYFGKGLWRVGMTGYYYSWLRIWTWKMREAKVQEMRNRATAD